MLECVKKCAGRNLEKEVEIQMAYITCKDLTLGYEGHAIVSDLKSVRAIIFVSLERMEQEKVR